MPLYEGFRLDRCDNPRLGFARTGDTTYRIRSFPDTDSLAGANNSRARPKAYLSCRPEKNLWTLAAICISVILSTVSIPAT
jgi:hypothetical protein